jgi:hypothetical protein
LLHRALRLALPQTAALQVIVLPLIPIMDYNLKLTTCYKQDVHLSCLRCLRWPCWGWLPGSRSHTTSPSARTSTSTTCTTSSTCRRATRTSPSPQTTTSSPTTSAEAYRSTAPTRTQSSQPRW